MVWVWCGVVWRGVAWRGVAWRGAFSSSSHLTGPALVHVGLADERPQDVVELLGVLCAVPKRCLTEAADAECVCLTCSSDLISYRPDTPNPLCPCICCPVLEVSFVVFVVSDPEA